MQTAIMDPEDDRPDPSFDDNWYEMTWPGPGLVQGKCLICQEIHLGTRTEGVKQDLILCAIGHILTGRRYTP